MSILEGVNKILYKRNEKINVFALPKVNFFQKGFKISLKKKKIYRIKRFAKKK